MSIQKGEGADFPEHFRRIRQGIRYAVAICLVSFSQSYAKKGNRMIQFIRGVNERLSGWPNTSLSVILILAAALFAVIAIWGTPILKVAAASILVL